LKGHIALARLIFPPVKGCTLLSACILLQASVICEIYKSIDVYRVGLV